MKLRLLAGLVFLSLPIVCVAADPTIAQLLEDRIIETNLPLLETQSFLDARVPRMPVVQSAEEWAAYAERTRLQVLRDVVLRGEAAKWLNAGLETEWLETIPGGPGYHIRKLRFEALPGLWIPALLYEPDQLTGKVPVVLNVNGHDGAGKAADYKQIRCINQAKRGMIALNVEWVGMGQLRSENFLHYRMNQLDLCGTSGLAPFFLSMKRGLDVLLEHEHADPERVAVAGLSGGGWQTITISALDTRVTLTDPVAGYSSFRTRIFHHSDLGDSEQTPCDLATVADYSHLTAMMAPRPTLLTFNLRDNCCFAADHALPPLLEAARPVFALFGKEDNLRAHVNYDPGTHNFDLDNRVAFYRMIGDHFYKDKNDYDPREIDCTGEIKTAEQLHVELPAENLDFHRIAVELMKSLPERNEGPEDAQMKFRWQRELRQTAVVKDYSINAQKVKTATSGDVTATYWRLRLSEAWTVPAVELAKGDAKKTALVVADAGKAGVAAQIEKLLQDGTRVVAVDPFYLGESKITSRDFLFALLVSAVGERPVGLQASQIVAAARWLASRKEVGPVTLVSYGPRVGVSALIAAALENNVIAKLVQHDALSSFKQIIENNWTVQSHPELFCFGLLKEFDVPQTQKLVNQ